MSVYPRGVGRATHIPRVEDWFADHESLWFTVREVSDALEIPAGGARSACTILHRRGFLISSRDEPWVRMKVTHGVDSKRSTIGMTFRTKRGFMAVSRFAPRAYPEAIFVAPDGDERAEGMIVGPFCVHCGNPLTAHGPQGECRNYRIHPLLPTGDLPPANRRTP